MSCILIVLSSTFMPCIRKDEKDRRRKRQKTKYEICIGLLNPSSLYTIPVHLFSKHQPPNYNSLSWKTLAKTKETVNGILCLAFGMFLPFVWTDRKSETEGSFCLLLVVLAWCLCLSPLLSLLFHFQLPLSYDLAVPPSAHSLSVGSAFPRSNALSFSFFSSWSDWVLFVVLASVFTFSLPLVSR